MQNNSSIYSRLQQESFDIDWKTGTFQIFKVFQDKWEPCENTVLLIQRDPCSRINCNVHTIGRRKEDLRTGDAPGQSIFIHHCGQLLISVDGHWCFSL